VSDRSRRKGGRYEPSDRLEVERGVRRVAEGKTPRDATRLLKRYLARHLYRLLENRETLMA